MRFPSKTIVERIRREYPTGHSCGAGADGRSPGTAYRHKGTIIGVDDTGSLLMRWDNGCRLNVVYEEDVVRKVGDRYVE